MKTPDTRKCIGCGTSFRFQWFKSFCSEKCRTSSRATELKKRNQKTGLHNCKNCSKEFSAKFTYKYCSKKCSTASFRKKRNAKKQIKEIGPHIGGSKQIGY